MMVRVRYHEAYQLRAFQYYVLYDEKQSHYFNRTFVIRYISFGMDNLPSTMLTDVFYTTSCNINNENQKLTDKYL